MSNLTPEERKALEERLEAVNKRREELRSYIEQAKTEDIKDFKDLRLRNEKRADDAVASFRNSIVGRFAEKLVYGESSTREQIQSAQDNASIGQLKQMLGSLKEGEYSSDPQIRNSISQLRVSSLLYQYYSGNSHDAAQDRYLLDIPSWTLAYRFGGALGSSMSIFKSLNQSASSETNFYELQRLRLSMTTDYLNLLNTTNIFAMNKNQDWLENEQMRGASSVDPVIGRARVEFQNMVAPPYAEYAKARNMWSKYEGEFIKNKAQYTNQQRRLGADLGFGLSN